MALGKGLAALIPGSGDTGFGTAGRRVVELDLEAIRPNPAQPRKQFEEEALEELAASIREKGVIQPILVRRREDGVYEIIAGERRWRAVRQAGFSRIPAIVQEATPEEMVELALIENIQRRDLNPLEEAEAYQLLIQRFGLSQEAVAQKVGKDRSSVANALRLLHLPAEVKKDLLAGHLSAGHAKALLALEEKEKILRAREAILRRGLSVRETERLVQRWRLKPRKTGRLRKDPHLQALQERLMQTLGTKVRILPGRKKGGRIELIYYTTEDLTRLVEQMMG
ncbi:MAG: ParB/RepB/Spo0J family partition protein [Nitrospirae bacterium]|nr:ParB/RepB/Spo0J family partition protein [Nitrospirota bacterium]